MIIDIHSHLGNILYPNGGDTIFKTGIPEFSEIDTITLAAQDLYRVPEELYKDNEDEFLTILGEGSQSRCFTATLENMQKSLVGIPIVKTACMPVPPHVVFEDLKAATKLDDRIIAFTGVDFTHPARITQQLEKDVANGAKGLKLHPIIQKTPANSEAVFSAVQTFSSHNLPVLVHCGKSSYYVNEERTSRQTVEFGSISPIAELVSQFQDVSFILGHAGLFEVEELISRLSRQKNTWVDISFQSPETIETLITAFGPERILFASDWPWGDRTTPIKTVKAACRGDAGLEHLIFYENAANLLTLND